MCLLHLVSKANDSRQKAGGSGLSCLASSTLDEDQPVPKSSPEKRSLLSPSVNSISEIFAKSASAKFATSKKDEKSPFAARKTQAPENRKSVFATEETGSENAAKTTSPGIKSYFYSF